MSAFRGKADIPIALQMSAYDPKRTARLTTSEGVIGPQNHHRADNCDEHAIKIETGYSGGTKKREQHSADDRADKPNAMSSIKPWP
jgi:hypothetical protein